MAEDEDLLDAIKEQGDRCKEAERQGAALAKAVDWMSQRIKVLESERDSANLQIRALRNLIIVRHAMEPRHSRVDHDCPECMALDDTKNSVTLKPKHKSDKR
jgi:translation initiation factor 2B subunit (eIF-2B alpha/beta/delta family)